MACALSPSAFRLLHLPVGRLLASCARRPLPAAVQHRMYAMTAAAQQRNSSPKAAPPPAAACLSLLATSPAATELLAEYFASDLQPGDVYLLHGSVGAGKSYFSRAFIRAAAGDDMLPVPSPTFLLQNTYDDHGDPPIHHYDLYRLEAPHDLARLDLAGSFASAVSLVEWPERLGAALPSSYLALRLAVLDEGERAAAQAAAAQAAEVAASRDGGEGERAGWSGDDADVSGDHRWRRIELAASGGERGAARLRLLQQYLREEGPESGCLLEEEERQRQRGSER